MDVGEGQLHIVIFPWLAFGHMIPFLELAKALARRGHLVSFLSTPRNVRRLPKIPPHLSTLINLVELPLPPTHGLPEGAESTMDLTVDRVQFLKKAFDSLEAPVAQFLGAASPAVDWVVHDFVQHWMPRAAGRTGVPCAFFSVYSPWCHCLFGPPSTLTGSGGEDSRTPPPPTWIPFAPWLMFRPHEASAVAAALYLPNASGPSDMRRFGCAIQGCRVFALRTSEELEPECLAVIRDLYGKPVVPVGLLAASVMERSDDGDVVAGGPGGGFIFEWLQKQVTGSVVYVALGSEAELSLELIHELALGMEQSELPFLWALRKPPGSPDGGDLLPPGFQDRVGSRGIVTMSWVPQIRVLSHPSVGVFLTHSGWSSVIEGLTFGLPLVLLPLFADQCLIAPVMERRKLGMEIPRADEDGAFTRDGVAGSLKQVVAGGDEAEAIRVNARRAGEVFGRDGSRDQCVDNFLQCLVTERRPPG